MSASASALRPGNFAMTSRTFLPILAASPTAGTNPTTDQNASPQRPPKSASTPSRMSPTASSPERTWPRMYSVVAREGAGHRRGRQGAHDQRDDEQDAEQLGRRLARPSPNPPIIRGFGLSPDPPIIRGCLVVVGAVRGDRPSILRVVPFGARPIGPGGDPRRRGAAGIGGFRLSGGGIGVPQNRA